LAVILLLEQSEQFKASWVDLLIIELRNKINSCTEDHFALIANDWSWTSKQISWKNASNSTKTLFQQNSQIIDKKHSAVPTLIKDISTDEFKLPIKHVQTAIDELCNTSSNQWSYLAIDIGSFFKASSTYVQCISTKNLFEEYVSIPAHIEEVEIKQKLMEAIGSVNDDNCIELSALYSAAYLLVLDNQLDEHRFCVLLALVASQLDYSSQLEFFDSVLVICSKYRLLEMSDKVAGDSVKSDLPINSSVAFALLSWTLIVSSHRCNHATNTCRCIVNIYLRTHNYLIF